MTIDHARAIRELLNDARHKLEHRIHPLETMLDIADAMRLASDIERLMIEAKIGVE